MGNHNARRFDALPEFGRVDKPLGANMFGVVLRWTRLGKTISSSTRAGPLVDRTDQSIKLPLRSDCHKNHSTEPV